MNDEDYVDSKLLVRLITSATGLFKAFENTVAFVFVFAPVFLVKVRIKFQIMGPHSTTGAIKT